MSSLTSLQRLAQPLLTRAMLGAGLALGCAAVAAPLASAATATLTASTVMQNWQRSYDRAETAYAAGQLDTAERAAREALAQARAGGGENQSFVASSLNLLALVRQQQGHADEAIHLLQEALAGPGQMPDGQANRAALAINLGRALEAAGRTTAALDAFQSALGHAKQLPHGPDAAVVQRQAHQALARLHAQLGQADQAALHHQRLLAADLPPDARSAALEQQARWQRAQGDLAGARQSWQQALALYEQLPSPAALDLVRCLGGLADVLTGLDLADQAAPLHQRALALLEPIAPNGPAMANHLNELGLWHLQRREHAASQPLLERSLAILEALDPASRETARVTANLAQLHEASGQDGQAQALFRQALSRYEHLGGTAEALLGQAQALNYLAGQDYRRRRIAQAEAQFLRAVALTEQADGPQSSRLLPLLDNLVTLYRSQHRPSQASAYAARAERLRDPER